MNSKERLITTLSGILPDRIPMCEISIWPSTFERWRQQGLPEEISIENYPHYFGLDRIGIISFDGSFQFEKKTIEETDRYVIERDEFGAKINIRGVKKRKMFLKDLIKSL